MIDHDILSYGSIEEYVPADLAAAAAAAASPAATGTAIKSTQELEEAEKAVAAAVEADKAPRSLVLDGTSLTNLEILENNYDGGSRGTLLGALGSAVTPMGQRLLRAWMTKPLFRIADINHRLDAVEGLMGLGGVTKDLCNQLRQMPDLERLLSRYEWPTDLCVPALRSYAAPLAPPLCCRIHSLGSVHHARTHPDAEAVMYEEITYSKRKLKDLAQALDGLDVSVHLLHAVALTHTDAAPHLRCNGTAGHQAAQAVHGGCRGE